MNLSNVLNTFTQNEWNISQMMQAIQITHTQNAYLFMFFSGSSLQFRYEHVSRASMMQHHIIQTVDFLVFGHTERLANRYVARVTENWHLLHELTFIITLISKFDITSWQWAHVREYICAIQRQIAFQQLRCSKIMTREEKKTKPTKMLHINVNTHNLLSGNWSCATFLLNIFRFWVFFSLELIMTASFQIDWYAMNIGHTLEKNEWLNVCGWFRPRNMLLQWTLFSNCIPQTFTHKRARAQCNCSDSSNSISKLLNFVVANHFSWKLIFGVQIFGLHLVSALSE